MLKTNSIPKLSVVFSRNLNWILVVIGRQTIGTTVNGDREEWSENQPFCVRVFFGTETTSSLGHKHTSVCITCEPLFYHPCHCLSWEFVSIWVIYSSVISRFPKLTIKMVPKVFPIVIVVCVIRSLVFDLQPVQAIDSFIWKNGRNRSYR